MKFERLLFQWSDTIICRFILSLSYIEVLGS